MNTTNLLAFIPAFALLVTILNLLFTKTFPWLTQLIKEHKLSSKLGSDAYAEGVIRESLRYYIKPFCQRYNPVGRDEYKPAPNEAFPLFKIIKTILFNPLKSRCIVILADSGMGKSSFLLNFYAHHLLRYRSKYKIKLFPLNAPDVDNNIKAITHKKNTILFLDALDEDIRAITNYKSRLRELDILCADFFKIVISCRSQFISDPNEINFTSRKSFVGPEPMCSNQSINQTTKLYLSYFTNDQINAFIKRRYYYWQFKKRSKTKKMVKRIHNLAMRPMILGYIDSLIGTNHNYKYSIQIYEEIVTAWLRREKKKNIKINISDLREFSDNLAIDIYLNVETRKSERISFDEIKNLSSTWGIKIEEWKLKGRSLINCDINKKYGFSHRSILEYLFVRCLVLNRVVTNKSIKLTDNMKIFVKEYKSYKNDVLRNVHQKKHSPDLEFHYLQNSTLNDANLSGCNLRGSNLCNSNLMGANLRGATLISADLRDTDLSGAILEDAILSRVNLSGSKLHNADLTGADLIGADLTAADLFRADLSYSDLSHPNQFFSFLSDSELRNPNFVETQFKNSHFRNAKNINTYLTNLDSDRTNLSGANLMEVRLVGANLYGANLCGSNLQRAYLDQTNLSQTNLQNANLTGADLQNANLAGADLQNAILRGANLLGTNLHGANLCGVDW